MLARRVIALSVDKAFGKVMATALRAAGGVVELHSTIEAMGTGELQAALLVKSPSGVCTTICWLTWRIMAGAKTPWPMKSATKRVAGRW